YDEQVATVYDLRFPRILISMLAGAALAASGALLQAVMKNPVADPGIIGISAGAGFFAVAVSALFPALYFMAPMFAVLGGLAAFALVYSLAWSSGIQPVRVILVGIAVGVVFTGLSDALNSFSGGNLSNVASIVNGNITMKTWQDVRLLASYAPIGLALAALTARHCNLMSLDDRTVRSLGVNVDRSRIIVSLIAVALASVSAAVVGVIGFLGLCAPHIARLLVGSDHKALIPFSMLTGAFMLLAVDTVGRTVAAPYEISAGILMAIFGGPCFIILLKKKGKEYGN
ncbi:MAG: iron ABC transporter permease, partial [Clostridiales Family XIII bacterium]|nr:iron ABC transporter permease [Clostridiales Family XIII bacterium]